MCLITRSLSPGRLACLHSCLLWIRLTWMLMDLCAVFPSSVVTLLICLYSCWVTWRGSLYSLLALGVGCLLYPTIPVGGK